MLGTRSLCTAVVRPSGGGCSPFLPAQPSSRRNLNLVRYDWPQPRLTTVCAAFAHFLHARREHAGSSCRASSRAAFELPARLPVCLHLRCPRRDDPRLRSAASGSHVKGFCSVQPIAQPSSQRDRDRPRPARRQHQACQRPSPARTASPPRSLAASATVHGPAPRLLCCPAVQSPSKRSPAPRPYPHPPADPTPLHRRACLLLSPRHMASSTTSSPPERDDPRPARPPPRPAPSRPRRPTPPQP